MAQQKAAVAAADDDLQLLELELALQQASVDRLVRDHQLALSESQAEDLREGTLARDERIAQLEVSYLFMLEELTSGGARSGQHVARAPARSREQGAGPRLKHSRRGAGGSRRARGQARRRPRRASAAGEEARRSWGEGSGGEGRSSAPSGPAGQRGGGGQGRPGGGGAAGAAARGQVRGCEA